LTATRLTNLLAYSGDVRDACQGSGQRTDDDDASYERRRKEEKIMIHGSNAMQAAFFSDKQTDELTDGRKIGRSTGAVSLHMKVNI
jgi:hypothetical protein